MRGGGGRGEVKQQHNTIIMNSMLIIQPLVEAFSNQH